MADEQINKSLAAAFRREADCPSLDDLILSLDAPHGSEEQRNAESHLASCPHCRTEWAMFQEFESASPRPDEQTAVTAIVSRLRKNSPVPGKSWWQSIGRPSVLLPASVALAAALLVLVFVLPPRTAVGPVIPTGPDVMRSQRIAIIGPTGDLQQAPRSLDWRPVAGASHYRVRLTEVDNTPLWETTQPGTSVELPANIRRTVTPRKTLLWEVTALNADGAVLADSGAQRFRVVTP